MTTPVAPRRVVCMGGCCLAALAAALLAGLWQAAAAGERQAGKPTSCGDYYGDPLPCGAVARLGTLRYRLGAEFPAGDMSFVPNRNELAAGSGRGVRFWDAQSGRLLREIDSGPVHAFALSADGATAATLGGTFVPERREYDRELNLWDAESGKKEATIRWTEPPYGDSPCLAFSPDGRVVVMGDGQGNLRFWDVASQQELLNYSVADRTIHSVAFSPDGQWVAAAGRDGLILWQWMAGEEPQMLWEGNRGARAVAFSPDGTWLAGGSDERAGIRVWQVATGRLAWQIDRVDLSFYPGRLEFTPDGRLLAVPLWQQGMGIELRDAASGELVRTFDAGHAIRGVSICSDGQLVAGNGAGTLKVWRIETGEALHEKFIGHDSAAYHLEFTHDGSQVVTGSLDGTVRLWDAATGRPLAKMRHATQPPASVVSLAVSPDSRWIASAGYNHTLRLWDRASGRERFQLYGHAELGAHRSNVAAFTPDSRLLSFGNDLFLRLWDVETGRALEELEIRPSGLDYQRHPDGTIELVDQEAADPFGYDGLSMILEEAQLIDGGRYLLLKRRRDLHRFETLSGHEVDTFQFEDTVTSFAVAPDGEVLASVERRRPADGGEQADWETLLRWRDFTSPENKVLREVELPYSARLIAFSPDGKLLATRYFRRSESGGPVDYWISVWDNANGEEWARIEGIASQPHHLVFSPDGRRLASTHADTTVLIWKLEHFRLQ